ncbi:MAG: chromate resistance protein [Armatimonadota bacterium]|nr:chromate resistance protein [Armatimonadota bacterium]
MKWVTRSNAKVDRVACPWLIRRFVDPEAEFLFLPGDRVLEVAALEGAIPFDVPGAELGHVEGRCSFESIVVRYGLDDPALHLLGRIVHGADIPEDVGIEPECAGLRAIAHGFALWLGEDDLAKLRLQTPLYEALYAWCKHRVREGG